MAPPRQNNRADRIRRRPGLRPLREDLETRVVLTGSGPPSSLPTAIIPAGFITPLATVTPEGGSGSPTGYSPQQIRAAYGFNQIQFGSVAGDGSGQTIAIVDAYDDPGLANSGAANFSTSDLAQFDRQYGLPDPPSFTKLNEAGNTSPLPGTDPAGAGNGAGNWEYEEAMDVEWAHALAPGASIVLVEADSSGLGDLYSALSTADHLAGVSVVSLSWGGAEFSGENYWDPNYQTPDGHQGVTFVTASGDVGAPGIFPAYSKNVLAVGGTELHLNADGIIQGETAWSNSGGGISAYEAEPSYQKGAQNTGYRTIPDVSFDASGSTGVSVYDSYDSAGGGPWVAMWGTSLGAPTWSALIAVADQGRVAAGGTTLDGASQTLPALYSVSSSDFHDITSGSNGSFSAGPGYDEVTGLGSPVANRLAPDLAFYGMSDHLVITGQPGSSVTAGQSFGFTVSVERPDGSIDAAASGTLIVSLAGQPGGASLGGTLSATIDQGVATFGGLSIDQAGSGYCLSVGGGGFGALASSTFAVTPAAASQLAIASQPPASLAAGGTFGLTVNVEDAYGNLAGGYSGNVTLDLAGGPGSGSLGGTVTIAASKGIATFSGLSIDQVGTGYTIAASADGLSSATSGSIDVGRAAPARLVIDVGPPASVTAGTTFGLKASVEDAYGNLETGYNGDVTVFGPSGAALGGTTTVAASGGVAIFSGLELTAAGSSDQLQVSSGSLPVVDSSVFRVIPAAPAQLVITRQPTTDLAAGVPFALGVSVKDAFGNLVPDAGTEVTLTLQGGPAGAGLGGTTTATTSGGVATFDGLAIDHVGSHFRVQAASPGLTSATSSDLNVTSAAPARLVITAQPPSSVTAGGGFGLGVSIVDAYGNLVTGYDGKVTVSLQQGPEGSSLSGPTAGTVSEGTATFSGLVLDRAAGGDVLAVTADGLGTVSTTAVSVSAAAPSQVVIVDQPPGGTIAGQSFGFTVAVEDPYGNVATGYDGTVTASLAKDPAGGSLTGGASVNAVNGVATFSPLNIDQAGGGYAVEASSGGWTSGASTPIAVSPAVPSRLIITVQPPDHVIVRRPFEVGVEAVDAYGNIATGFTGVVTAALGSSPRGTRMVGNSSVPASGGQVLLSNLSLTKPGKSYTVTVTSAGLSPALTSVFEVTRTAFSGGEAAVRRSSRFALRVHPHATGHTPRFIRPRPGAHPGMRGSGPGHHHGH